MDSREYLREQNYTAAEREVTMREELAVVREEEMKNLLPDGRPMWTPEDDKLLMTSEELNWFEEWKGETFAEIGSEYFLDTRNEADANFYASRHVQERVAKRFGMPAVAVNRHYERLYARPVKNLESYWVKSDRKKAA